MPPANRVEFWVCPYFSKFVYGQQLAFVFEFVYLYFSKAETKLKTYNLLQHMKREESTTIRQSRVLSGGYWASCCIVTIVKNEQIAAIFFNDPLPYTTDKWDWSGGNKYLSRGKYFFSDLVNAQILGKIRFSLCEKAEGVGEYGHSPFYVGWSRCSEAIKVIYWSERGSPLVYLYDVVFVFFPVAFISFVFFVFVLVSCCICICMCICIMLVRPGVQRLLKWSIDWRGGHTTGVLMQSVIRSQFVVWPQQLWSQFLAKFSGHISMSVQLVHIVCWAMCTVHCTVSSVQCIFSLFSDFQLSVLFSVFSFIQCATCSLQCVAFSVKCAANNKCAAH